MAALITTKLDIESISFYLSSSIDTALAAPSVNAEVVDCEKRFYTINVADAMGQLTQVGDLLQTAYAASIGYKCSPHILEVLAEYQPLVGDSFVATSDFVCTSLVAFEKHKLAYRIAKKGEGEAPLIRALTIMLKCGDLAGRMALKAGEMKARAVALYEKSRNLLILCSQDECLEMEKQREIMEMIKKTEVEQERFTSLKEDLAQQVGEAKQRERRATVRKDDVQKQQFILGLVNGMVLEQQMRNNNAALRVALRATLKKMENMKISETSLGVVIESFKVTAESLISIRRHCKELSRGDLTDLVDAEMKEDFMEHIVQNATAWLAFAHINQCANEKMREVNATISGIMSNLPDKKKAQQLMSKNVKLLLRDLDENDEVMSALK